MNTTSAAAGPLCLVLDQGGSSSRAMVFDSAGRVVSSAQQPVATLRPQPGHVEQDPAEVVLSLQATVSNAVSALTDHQRRQLRVAGLVCQRSSLVAWEPDTGTTLTPIISWQDTRAARWLAAQALDNDQVQRLTGLWPNAHFGASKMRWCLDYLPALQQSHSAVLAPLASYLAYALLREQPVRVDPANASRTLLMELASHQWSPQLLSLFGIERQRLPDIVPSDSEFGTLVVDGLTLPLRLLNGDQSAAAFADGNPQPDCVYINLGTGAFIYRPLPRPPAPERQLCSVIYASGEQALYAAEGTVNGAGSALQWLTDNSQGAEQQDIDWALRLSPGDFSLQQSGLPLFLNGVGGLGSPDWRADFRSRFSGTGSGRQQALAVLESIAFLLRRNFDRLCQYRSPPHRIIVSGGLSGCNLLCQLLADLTGIEVARVEEREASARGAAWLLLWGASRKAEAADGEQWQMAETESFQPANATLPEQRYRQWSGLLQAELDRHPQSGD
ncbi:FGGY family carbohydrate kinase [Pseudomaricurvus sp. HS19]|uniref:FGGY family carbohydrate kinase n=1 Tax=Pseudomaricurvus sp. HS19 TaxID=2692626 RepID=UPI00136918EF|nr:FGGY family carbohydrate kinase [Pseudomaricurvus sp. HS19]MYM64068.1 hypothetical protein [Pseudomaricurvus sp. HS19]